jgi:hypothetical protein
MAATSGIRGAKRTFSFELLPSFDTTRATPLASSREPSLVRQVLTTSMRPSCRSS